MQDAKEEVRSKLAIEDVIGEYVQLKRAGRTLKGLSPFTDEKTPSFMVSPEKQIWHDFSSSQGGDIFSFIMLVEGLDFRQALEHLARKAGVDLSLFSRGDGKVAKRKEKSKEVLKLAASFFGQVLLRTPNAQNYVLQKRHLNKQTIQDFTIGYAPEIGSALTVALKKRGFSSQELADAGLVNRYGTDLFRDRMMVALKDSSGEIIGFTGRIIGNDPKAPKYLNTPQTLLFDKSRHVFGLDQAKEAIRKSDVAVIVEGNLDVISSHQAGVKNVVATSGTAMTEQHLRTLHRLASRIRLAFDGDKAGVAATERVISLAQSVGVELEVINMPSGAKDPDELIQQDAKKWSEAIEKAVPAVDWIIDRYGERENLTTAEGKRNFSSAAIKLIRELKDPVVQEHYLKIIAEKTGASMEALKSKLDNKTVPTQRLKSPKVEKVKPQNNGDDFEDRLLGLFLVAPETRRWLPALKPEHFATENARQVLNFLRQEPAASTEQIQQKLQKSEEYVKIVQLKSDIRYANREQDSLLDEMARLVKQIIIKHRETKKQLLEEKLRDAEQIGDEVVADGLRQELNTLIKEQV